MRRLKRIGQYLKQALKIYRLVLKSPHIPTRAKLFLTFALGYLLLPLDLIPDFLLGLGQVDDLIIVFMLVTWALRLIPKEILNQYRAQARRIEITA